MLSAYNTTIIIRYGGCVIVRQPIVAGTFYPEDTDLLKAGLSSMIPDCADKRDVIGAVCPHAGYIYSGKTAGLVYGRIPPKDLFVIIGPSHTGLGERYAVSSEDWKTPLGVMKTNKKFVKNLARESSLLKIDERAHAGEHSVEVQIPFVQMLSPKAEIVSIILQPGEITELKEIASLISEEVKRSGENTVIIASTDMSHYETRETAGSKDRKAIETILDMDPEGLIEIVMGNNISMCGVIPTAVMLFTAKFLNAKEAELVEYADSGKVTGDISEVVGYAGLILR